jgi:hypothetical protein
MTDLRKAAEMITIVRCGTDRTVFEIDPITLEAKTCSYYDAYCYLDPRNDVTYIEYSDWVGMRNEQWDKQMHDYYKKRVLA